MAWVAAWLDFNLFFLNSIFSSPNDSSFIWGHSSIGFSKKEGPFNQRTLEVNTFTVVPLLTRSAGFLFVGTCFPVIGFVIDWISVTLLAKSDLNFQSLHWIHQSTFILSPQNASTSILSWNANLNLNTALNSSNLGMHFAWLQAFLKLENLILFLILSISGVTGPKPVQVRFLDFWAHALVWIEKKLFWSS